MGLFFAVTVLPIAGPVAGILTYLLVVGAMEPTLEILRVIVFCWVGYLLCIWIFVITMEKDDDFPDTNRFSLFVKWAIGILGILLGGLGTLVFGAEIFFPGPGEEISQANVRDGLVAIVFLTAGILLMRKPLGSTPRLPYEQYPDNWEDIRRTVLKRDDYRCANCQSTENLHVHHIVPLSVGGSNELSNLKTLCKACHTKLHPHMRD